MGNLRGYYVVMALAYPRCPSHMYDLVDMTYEEYTGRHWGLDQELEAQEELWDARHDGEIEDAYLKEVIF